MFSGPKRRPKATWFRRQALVTKEDDLMLDQCGPDLRDQAVGLVDGEVDAGDFSAQRPGDLADGQAHAVLPQTAAHLALKREACKAGGKPLSRPERMEGAT